MDPEEYEERRAAVGYVAEMSTFLEYTVVLLIGTLLGDKAVGRAVATGRGVKQAIAMARRLAPLKLDEASVERLRKALKAAEDALDARNVIIHSIWGAGKSPGAEWTHNIWEVAPLGLHEQFGVEEPFDFRARAISLEEVRGVAAALDGAATQIREAVPLLSAILLA